MFQLKTRTGRLRATSRMMRADCEAAGVPYVGELGCADFHACRATFITNLCRSASTDFGTIVELARHADARLTTKIYDKIRLETKASAVNQLPIPMDAVPQPKSGDETAKDGAT